MKYTIILTLLFFFSCKKDDTELTPNKVDEYPSDTYLDKDVWLPGPMTDGFIQAKKNGLDWKASAEGVMYNSQFWVFAAAFNSKGFERDELSFHNIMYKPQKYIPNNKSNDNLKYTFTFFGRLAGDGDVIANLPQMIVDTTVNSNYLDIITLDTIANIIEARFDVSLISEANQKKEKMRFSNGYLKVKIRRG